ncbi:MAG: TadE/TadG family type IV pilus assembly protein [Dehalococcoidia bacterium]|nr:TadE/TadG family type IV pilus assembly protein [Dehalococcoidia bacterium]
MGHRGAGPNSERGQALVEAALVIPVLLLLVFGVVMAGRISHAKVAVQAAAREASRELATAASEQDGLTAALQTARSVADDYGLEQERLTVDMESNGFQRGGTTTARVTYRVGLGDLPLLGRLGVTVSSSHSERIDLYRSREAVLR